MIFHLEICVGLLLPLLGAYIAWPSRWNIPAHQLVGLALPSTLIPAIGTSVIDHFPPNTTELYLNILIIGGLTYITGIIVSRFFKFRVFESRINAIRMYESAWTHTASAHTKRIATLALIGLWISFAVMGFLPIFASDPFSAKFFRGAYQEPYHRVAWLFRFCFVLATLVIPILLSDWWMTKRRSPLMLAGLLILSMLATLVRGGAMGGLLTFVGLVMVRRRKIKTYIFICIFAFIAGSAGYFLIGSLISSEILTGLNVGESFAEVVSSGAPDIADDLNLFNAFEDRGERFTYGRTFLGGLIPFTYQWNPAVWTLTTVNNLDVGDDISDVSSGGLRAPVALWGYFSFGWAGVLVIPFVSGFLLGWCCKALRKIVIDNNLILGAVVMVFYTSVITQIAGFYFMSIYSIPSIFLSFYLFSTSTIRKKSKSLERAIGLNA